MSTAPLVAIRCDGVAETGLGHVSRCLGLAEALVESAARVVFLGTYNETARAMLDGAAMKHVALEGWDGAAIATRVRELGAASVVLDSYVANEDTLRAVSAAAPLLVVDDFARLARYDCAAVLNFTVGAATKTYPLSRSRCFAGPEVFPARRRLRELRKKSDAAREAGLAPTGARVLLSFGGGAWQSAARAMLEMLHAIAPDVEVAVVAGAGADEGVPELVSRFRGGGRLLRARPDLADEFGWADTCISGGGMTKYEAAYLGLPVAIASRTTDEGGETTEFEAAGLGIDLGLATKLEPSRVRAGLERVLRDTSERRRLRAATRARFPADGALRAAHAWLRIASEIGERR